MSRLEHFLNSWIQLSEISETFESLKEFLLQDQFLNSCPKELATFIREHSPSNLETMIDLANKFNLAHNAPSHEKERKGKHSPHQGGDHMSLNHPHHVRSEKKLSRPPFSSIRCYLCHRPGHKANECRVQPTRPNHFNKGHSEFPKHVNGNAGIVISSHDCSIGNHKVKLSCGCSIPIMGSACVDHITNLPTSIGFIGKERVHVLRDTGCNDVVIRKGLVNPKDFTGNHKLTMLLDRTIIKVPVAHCHVNTPWYSGSTDVLCIDDPVYDLIIGNVEGVHLFIDPSTESDSEEVKILFAENKSVEDQSNLITPNDSFPEEIESKNTEIKTQTLGCVGRARNDGIIENHGNEPLIVRPPIDINVSACNFKQAQKDDPSLRKLFLLANRDKNFTQNKHVMSWYEVRGEVLFRLFHPNKSENIQKQLVVPHKFRQQVLQIGHETLLSGHQGTKKTLQRIMLNFYWPGISGEVKRFCASCDICQRTINKGNVKRAPLQKMPIINTPFQKVSIDLIGPLSPVTERGNRWILTLVDSATRYPEAVALQTTNTVEVAEKLLGIFFRVGFPSQVLCDNGSQFTSKMMEEVARLLSTKFIHTSLYHPMSNGLYERWNGTLKTMLKRMSLELPRDWDRYLEPLMFAYREAPQESTGFSPFELLYGRTVQGPMYVLRKLWTNETMQEEVSNVYQYVVDLRNRLEKTCELAAENLRNAQSKYKSHFDKKSKMRILEAEEKVLILLPTEKNKLLMQWKGPFTVKENIGPTDYRIQMGNKAKIFHINMLKRYIERPEIKLGITAAILDYEDSEYLEVDLLLDKRQETFRNVHVASQLSSKQKDEVQQILEEFSEIFSDIPGCVKDTQHAYL